MKTATTTPPAAESALTDFTMKTTSIKEEVMLAYSDSHGDLPFATTQHTRNLRYRAGTAVSRDEAVAIMSAAVEQGYNSFTATLLKKLPEDAEVFLAREGSVCVYIKGKTRDLAKAMLADEWNYDANTNETRIWWD